MAASSTLVYGKACYPDTICNNTNVSSCSRDFDNKVAWAWRNIASLCDIKELLRLCRVCSGARRGLRFDAFSWKSITVTFDISNCGPNHCWISLGRDGTSIETGPQFANVVHLREVFRMIKSIKFDIMGQFDLLDRSMSSVTALIRTIDSKSTENVNALTHALPLFDLYHLVREPNPLISLNKLKVLHVILSQHQASLFTLARFPNLEELRIRGHHHLTHPEISFSQVVQYLSKVSFLELELCHINLNDKIQGVDDIQQKQRLSLKRVFIQYDVFDAFYSQLHILSRALSHLDLKLDNHFRHFLVEYFDEFVVTYSNEMISPVFQMAFQDPSVQCDLGSLMALIRQLDLDDLQQQRTPTNLKQLCLRLKTPLKSAQHLEFLMRNLVHVETFSLLASTSNMLEKTAGVHPFYSIASSLSNSLKTLSVEFFETTENLVALLESISMYLQLRELSISSVISYCSCSDLTQDKLLNWVPKFIPKGLKKLVVRGTILVSANTLLKDLEAIVSHCRGIKQIELNKTKWAFG